MIHKPRNFLTLHISKFILMNSSGSKLNKITIMGLKIKIMMTSFMVIIILYSLLAKHADFNDAHVIIGIETYKRAS